MTTISGVFGAQTVSNFKVCNCFSTACLPHASIGAHGSIYRAAIARNHAFSTHLAASSDSGLMIIYKGLISKSLMCWASDIKTDSGL